LSSDCMVRGIVARYPGSAIQLSALKAYKYRWRLRGALISVNSAAYPFSLDARQVCADSSDASLRPNS
jgi:hypothetical protein